MKWRSFLSIALVAAVAGLAAATSAQERFDYTVRDAMFRAFGGNEAAFKHAQAIIDEKLREDPDHAEALVWRGVGRYFQAGRHSARAMYPRPGSWRRTRSPTWTARSACSRATSRC